MPVYEFMCLNCNDGIRMSYHMQMSESDVQEVECWVCGGVAKKVVSKASFELKGGGWYDSGYSK